MPETKPPQDAAGPPRGEKILVVDDEDMVRELVLTMLGREGYEVSAARNGREALDLLEGEGFDLVLTDLVMPEMEGIETSRDILARYPGIKVVAMSGVAESATYLMTAEKLGVSETLAKPFRRKQLLEVVGRVLRGAGSGSPDSEALDHEGPNPES